MHKNIYFYGPKYGVKTIREYTKPELLNVALYLNYNQTPIYTDINFFKIYYTEYYNTYTFYLNATSANHINKNEPDYFDIHLCKTRLQFNQFIYQNNVLTFEFDTYICPNINTLLGETIYYNLISTYITTNNTDFIVPEHIKVVISLSDISAKKIQRFFTAFPTL